MREYGVVSPMFWIGKTGRALRKNPNAQRVAIYLMTAPSSEMTGVFYCPLSSILNDVGVFEAPFKPLISPSEGALEGGGIQLLGRGKTGYSDTHETSKVSLSLLKRWLAGKLGSL